jgi:hypothetical protein
MCWNWPEMHAITMTYESLEARQRVERHAHRPRRRSGSAASLMWNGRPTRHGATTHPKALWGDACYPVVD